MSGNPSREQLKAQVMQAASLQQRGELASAATAYREVLKVAPSMPIAWLMLARVERQRARYPAAAEALKRVQQLMPASTEVLAETGYLALATNDNGRARDAFAALTQQAPQLADGFFNLGQAYKGLGEHAPAIAAFEQAIARGIDEPAQVYTELGLVQTLDRQLDAARDSFTRALAQQPALPRALHGMAVVLISDGDFERARPMLRQAVAGDPNLVEAYQHLADSHRFESVDDPDVALIIAAYQASAATDYTREKLGFALGKIFNDCGEYDRAFEYYRSANALKKARVPAFEQARQQGYSRRLAQVFDRQRLAAATPVDQAPGTPQPLFIVGMPRSGTTLVEQILSSHSQVAGAGERIFLENEIVGRLAPYPDSFENGALPAAFEDVRGEYLQHLAQFADGERFVTDKFPANFQHLGLIALLFPGSAVVHCQRDPLDNCLSIYFQDFGRGNYFSYDLQDIASVHNDYRALMAHWAQVLPAPAFELDYEALVADQAHWTRALLAHCKLPFEEACLQFEQNKRVVDTLSRWQVRQPIYTQSVRRWQRYERHLQPLRTALSLDSS